MSKSHDIANAIDGAQSLTDDDSLVDDPGETYPPDGEDIDWDLLRRCAAAGVPEHCASLALHQLEQTGLYR